MSGSRILPLVGAVAAAGGGYYLYQAGGSPKVAEKQIEKDAATLSRKIKGELPGAEKEAKEQGKLWGEQARQNVNQQIEQAKSAGRDAEKEISKYTSEAEKKLSAYGKDAEKKLEELRRDGAAAVNQTANKFDKEVAVKSEQAKGWFSGWFGSK